MRASDPGECLFCATKNFRFNHPLSENVAPFGNKRCVIFHKDGGGRLVDPKPAASPEVGLMPGATSTANPGQEGGNFWE